MRHISRRDFLKTGALAAGLTIVPNSVLGKTHGFTSPSDKLNIAGVGVGGMGRGNLRNMSTENIVALCDVDWRYAEKTFNDYPKAKKFKDWRVMFDEFGKSIDAILVATPDHTHAGVTAHAITLGKHCYTQNRRAQAGLRPGDAPLCLLAGGETTVTIRGNGKGGRNQEMALAATLELADDRGIDLICVGTDGTDGPTDAAGGYAFSGDLARLRAIGLHPKESLDANDSYPLLLKAGTLLRTGPTRTNVMDMSIMLVRPK